MHFNARSISYLIKLCENGSVSDRHGKSIDREKIDLAEGMSVYTNAEQGAFKKTRRFLIRENHI